MDSATGVKRLQNDLISRDELISDLAYVPPELLIDRNYLYARIMKLHTVDAVPVKRGRWEADSDGLPVCSVCDEVAMQRLHCDTLHRAWRYDVRLVKTPYCPNCGAKMGKTDV